MNDYQIHIKAKNRLLDLNLREFFRYKDLIGLFVKRNYSTRYKQTILGPLWLVLNPLLTVTLYALVFGNIAGISTAGAPQFLFYLSSNAIWTFFATSLTSTAATFTANSAIMGKVYFPRLVMPVSSVLTGLFDFGIQFGMLVVAMVVYAFLGESFSFSWQLLLVPILIFEVGCLGLGCGIIIAALTTKYRDLAVLVSFGVSLWMYASPVVYTISELSGLYKVFMINPMAPIITTWRHVIIGTEFIPWDYLGLSVVETAVFLFFGVILFNKVEKTFMDTV